MRLLQLRDEALRRLQAMETTNPQAYQALVERLFADVRAFAENPHAKVDTVFDPNLQKKPSDEPSKPEPFTASEVLRAADRGDGCLGRSQSDEPVFVLCARDRLAAGTVRIWAALAEENGVSHDKIAGALVVADATDAWRLAHGGGKIPD